MAHRLLPTTLQCATGDATCSYSCRIFFSPLFLHAVFHGEVEKVDHLPTHALHRSTL
jgi:hypothetical protein